MLPCGQCSNASETARALTAVPAIASQAHLRDLLPARPGDRFPDAAGLVLSGFEALSQYGEATGHDGAEPVYPMGALIAVLTVRRVEVALVHVRACLFAGDLVLGLSRSSRANFRPTTGFCEAKSEWVTAMREDMRARLSSRSFDSSSLRSKDSMRNSGCCTAPRGPWLCRCAEISDS